MDTAAEFHPVGRSPERVTIVAVASDHVSVIRAEIEHRVLADFGLEVTAERAFSRRHAELVEDAPVDFVLGEPGFKPCPVLERRIRDQYAVALAVHLVHPVVYVVPAARRMIDRELVETDNAHVHAVYELES